MTRAVPALPSQRPVWRIQPSDAPARRSSARIRIALLLGIAVVGVVLLAALIALNTAPGSFVVAPGGTTGYRPKLVAGLVAVLLALAIGARAAHDTVALPRAAARTAVVALLVVLALAVQFRLAWGVLQYGSFDSMQQFAAAYHASVSPTPTFFTAGERTHYFAMLPNNAFLAAVWTVAFSALHGAGVLGVQSYLWFTVVVNCLAIDTTVVLVWFVARRIGDRYTVAVTAAAAVALVVVSPWLDVPYSDTLGFAFPIGIVALFLAWPARWPSLSRLGLWAAIGLVTAVGYSIKPTVVFAALALLLAELLQSSGRTLIRIRRVGALAASFGIVLLVLHTAIPHWIDATGVLPFAQGDNRGALPFTHFLAMGATGNGSYNQADVDASLATPSAQRSASDLSLFLGRVAGMGPVGYALFLGKKLLYAFSDGTFYQDREGIGTYSRSFFHGDPLSAAMQSIFPNLAPNHWLLSSAWQGVWFVVVLLCLVPLGRSLPSDRRPIVAALRVAVLLMVVFLLFSESRSRYLYLYLPFMLVLAGLGARSFTDGFGRVMARARRRPIA